MKKILNYFLILALFSLTGCAFFRNPLKAFMKAENRVNHATELIQTNQDKLVVEATKYVYAADATLRNDPSPNRYNVVAQDFTSKALILTGPPKMDDIQKLEKIVQDLLSTNQAIIAKGEQEKSVLYNQAAKLQEQNKSLQDDLNSAQTKLTKVGQANAILANKWAKVMKIIYGIGAFFVLTFVLKVASVLVPPPYNSIVGIVAMPLGLIFNILHNLIPEIKEFAGVVGSEYKSATTQLVGAIQELKTQNPALHSQISATVANNVESSAIQAIHQTKTELGIVS